MNLRPGQCSYRGPSGEQCTDGWSHRYAHYDASADVSWNDHFEDHRDDCQCTACDEAGQW